MIPDDLFRLLFEATPDAMLLLENGVFIDCNQAVIDNLGCHSKAELLALPPEAISPERQPDGRLSVEKAGEMIDTALARGHHCFEWTHQRMNGETFPVEITLTKLSLPGRTILCSVWRDISFRKEMEAALQQANKRLEYRVQERTRQLEQRRRVAESLRDTVGVLNANRPLDELLDYLAQQAREIIGADACALCRLDRASASIRLEAASDLPVELTEPRVQPLDSLFAQVFAATIQHGKVAYHDFVAGSARLAHLDAGLTEPARQQRGLVLARYAAALSVPLEIRREMFGCLIFYYAAPQELPQEQIRLARTFAEQAALVIENAHLHARVGQTAAEAERGRLARELHDSVTQTLFSASLIADVLPRLWERDPDDARAQLEELRLLTRGALAEMRTLLLELRPAALLKADLGELLRHLVEAARGRAGIPITLSVEQRCDHLPGEVRVALYRIAQETLNNVVKHAGASSAAVMLGGCETKTELRIEDDGCGFNTATVLPESLGLGIMAERAHSIGAHLHIESYPGAGTRVRVTWDRIER